MSIRHLLFIAATLFTITAHAQIRCATDILEKQALLKNPQQRIEFESWMKKKISGLKTRDNSGARTTATYVIPLVVHILHNGEAVGAGANIPDAQVISQIKVLNEDYKRMNADAVNTPAEFAPVASSVDIDFILAKQDPDGLPTNGITRTLASKNGFTVSDGPQLKSQSYWPAEDYLNIWVVNLTDSHLGFAQFPQTSLQGPEPPYDRLTDGVVIHYRAFGSSADGPFNLLNKYNKGRTTTHEIGHFLSLLHTFGNGGSCSTTDFVSDTPSQSIETLSCPSSPLDQCGHHVMFQNYLDYTDDACMNMFTTGQMARVVTVLENSPRRTSLLTSHGAIAPVILSLDLEAKNVEAPFAVTCGQSITPRVVVRNRGTTTVTSARVSFIVNGNTVETKDFAVNIGNLGLATLSFSAVNLPEPSSNNVSFTIVQVNSGGDNDASNNTTSLTSQVTTRVTPPYTEPFNTLPSNWQIVNPDNGTTWQNTTAPKSTSGNKAMYIDLYNYQAGAAKDRLVSPFFNIADADAILKFDRAYAMFQSVGTETLKVFVSTGCSTDLTAAVEIYSKSGPNLATAPSQSTPFVPNGESQWATDAVSLSAYSGKNIRLIFESTNANGNNLYVDNIQVSTGELYDVRVVSMISPGPVFCNPKPVPVIEVQNLGTNPVNRLSVLTEVNGSVSASQTLTGLAMTPGAMVELTLQALNLTQSVNNIKITISNPDAVTDDLPSNNVLTVTRIFNTASETIPLRQTFDNSAVDWTIFSEGTAKKWEATTTSTYQNSLVFKGFVAGTLGDESWLVSPVLDFTSASEGSLLFTTSYAQRGNADDALRIMVSEDCGENYTEMVFSKSGEELSGESSSAEWKPSTESNWRHQYLSINEFAGKKDLRFAFVATNDNGNNLYLDNIEFFVADNPSPPRTEEILSVYNSETNPYEFLITFNLPQKQDARLLVYNSVGQMLIDSELPGTLNQTYTVNLYGQSTGVYVARLVTSSQASNVKLFVGR